MILEHTKFCETMILEHIKFCLFTVTFIHTYDESIGSFFKQVDETVILEHINFCLFIVPYSYL